ncbi:MAG: DNRLRE domain-containing protein [Candidatus Hadarchaeales archaeon]
MSYKSFFFFFLFLLISPSVVEAGIGVGVKWSDLPIPVPYGQDVTVEINVWNWAENAENVLVWVQFVKITKEDGSPVPSGWFENIRIIPSLENIPVRSYLSKAVEPVDDTYISEEQPNQTFGGSRNLVVGGTEGSRKMIFLKFDLTDLPEGSKIESAVLYLRNRDENFEGKIVKVYGLDNDGWNGDTLNWARKPENLGEQIAQAVMPSPGVDVGWLVTPWVYSQYNKDGIISFVLLTENSGETIFASGETADWPRLEVVYSAWLGMRVEANFLLPNLREYVRTSRAQPKIPKEIENYADAYSLAYYLDNGEGLWIPVRRVFLKMKVSKEALGGIYTIYVDVFAQAVRGGAGGGLGATYSVEAKPKIKVIAPAPPIPIPVLITILAIIAILIVLFILWWAVRKKKIELRKI